MNWNWPLLILPNILECSGTFWVLFQGRERAISCLLLKGTGKTQQSYLFIFGSEDASAQFLQIPLGNPAKMLAALCKRVQTQDWPTCSGGLQISLLCYCYDSCFEQYICYEEVFRCLFKNQPTIVPKLISFCKLQHIETYHHPLLQNKQRFQSNFITASECPCLKENIARRIFY